MNANFSLISLIRMSLETDESPPDNRRLFFSSLAAQGGALVVAKFATAPFDRLRLLRQVGLISGPGWHWNGCATHLVQISASNAIRLLCVIKAGQGDLDGFMVNWAACLAAVSITYPLDLRYSQKVSGVPRIENKNFMKRKYPGFGFSLISTPIFLATALSVVEIGKRFFPDEVKKFPGNVASGALAGLVAGGVTYPLDTLRRRHMLGLPRPINPQQLFGGFGFHLAKIVPEYCVLAGVYSYLVNLSYL
jgi:hypothetical protein